MRPATLFLTVALLSVPIIRAQNQDVIRPGDILVVKLVSDSKWASGISRTVLLVTPEGKIKPPPLQGTLPREDMVIGGMGLGEAAQKVQQSYQTLKPGARVQVVIERGTLNQLLPKMPPSS